MKKHISVLVLLVAATIFVHPASAQERGQYLPGFRGLNNAEQPAPGLTYVNYFIRYSTHKFKDRNGDTAPIDFDLGLNVDINLFAYSPKKKVFGATYAAAAMVPVMNSAITIPRLGADLTGSAAFGDIYIEPVSLGWALKKGKAKVRAAYGFMMPNGAKRVTSDYWGHWFTLGGSHTLGKTRLWQVNASSVWEVHQKKRSSDVKVGNNVTFEYGVGRTWVKNKGARLFQLGVVGYSEFQLTTDTGTGVPVLSRGVKDRVHAVGPEFGVILPAKKFNFMIRMLPEYGAHSRTQGLTFVTSFGKTF